MSRPYHRLARPCFPNLRRRLHLQRQHLPRKPLLHHKDPSHSTIPASTASRYQQRLTFTHTNSETLLVAVSFVNSTPHSDKVAPAPRYIPGSASYSTRSITSYTASQMGSPLQTRLHQLRFAASWWFRTRSKQPSAPTCTQRIWQGTEAPPPSYVRSVIVIGGIDTHEMPHCLYVLVFRVRAGNPAGANIFRNPATFCDRTRSRR